MARSLLKGERERGSGPQRQLELTMENAPSSVFTRDDTFFGVCQALGEDLRIPPNLLRVALAVGLFWNPVAVAGIYAACGVLVFLTRWLGPEPKLAAQAEPEAPEAAGTELAEQAQAWEDLAVAA